MSALDNVRRLLESATMKARAVISAMNTIIDFFQQQHEVFLLKKRLSEISLSQALQKRIGAKDDCDAVFQISESIKNVPSAAII